MSNPLTLRRNDVQAAGPSTPAIAGRNLRWLRLNQLPGFLCSAIRAMGESVFSPFTRTRLERIEVIADLGGNGPHARREIDTTAHQLRRTCAPSNIVEYSSTEMAQLFGGAYQAQAIQFETAEITYLLVKDAMGIYIYRWPGVDTVTRCARIGLDRHQGQKAINDTRSIRRYLLEND